MERMVQYYKRMIKYRSTAYPELMFLNDYLLVRTCMRIFQAVVGAALLSLSEAVAAARDKRRKRPTQARTQDDIMLGAPKKLTEAETLEVLPTERGADGATGLPYLLAAEGDLSTQGWPTCAHIRSTLAREWMVMRRLGMDVNGRAGDAGVYIELMKYARAHLPVGDTVSCVQCTTQRRKDNSFIFIEYLQEDGSPIRYVGHFQYFVMAEFKTANGFNIAEGMDVPAEPLRLGVVNLFKCDTVRTPGVRPPDPELGRPPEFLTVRSLIPTGQNRETSAYEGLWVVDLQTVNTQLVPTRPVNGRRYFMTANKASGRLKRVKP